MGIALPGHQSFHHVIVDLVPACLDVVQHAAAADDRIQAVYAHGMLFQRIPNTTLPVLADLTPGDI